MNLQWIWVSLNLLVIVNTLSESDFDTHIEFTDIGYEDACSKASQSHWNFINKPSNETLQLWVKKNTKITQIINSTISLFIFLNFILINISGGCT